MYFPSSPCITTLVRPLDDRANPFSLLILWAETLCRSVCCILSISTNTLVYLPLPGQLLVDLEIPVASSLSALSILYRFWFIYSFARNKILFTFVLTHSIPAFLFFLSIVLVPTNSPSVALFHPCLHSSTSNCRGKHYFFLSPFCAKYVNTSTVDSSTPYNADVSP